MFTAEEVKGGGKGEEGEVGQWSCVVMAHTNTLRGGFIHHFTKAFLARANQCQLSVLPLLLELVRVLLEVVCSPIGRG